MSLDAVLQHLARTETLRRFARLTQWASQLSPLQLQDLWMTSTANATAASLFAVSAQDTAKAVLQRVTRDADEIRRSAIAQGIGHDQLTPERVEAWAQAYLEPESSGGLWLQPWDYQLDLPRSMVAKLQA